jgi:hypothetical protein
MKFMWLAVYVWVSPNYAESQKHWEGHSEMTTHELYRTEGECISKSTVELYKSVRCLPVSFPDWETYR